MYVAVAAAVTAADGGGDDDDDDDDDDTAADKRLQVAPIQWRPQRHFMFEVGAECCQVVKASPQPSRSLDGLQGQEFRTLLVACMLLPNYFLRLFPLRPLLYPSRSFSTLSALNPPLWRSAKVGLL